jgi:hypothetical protein
MKASLTKKAQPLPQSNTITRSSLRSVSNSLRTTTTAGSVIGGKPVPPRVKKSTRLQAQLQKEIGRPRVPESVPMVSTERAVSDQEENKESDEDSSDSSDSSIEDHEDQGSDSDGTSSDEDKVSMTKEDILQMTRPCCRIIPSLSTSKPAATSLRKFLYQIGESVRYQRFTRPEYELLMKTKGEAVAPITAIVWPLLTTAAIVKTQVDSEFQKAGFDIGNRYRNRWFDFTIIGKLTATRIKLTPELVEVEYRGKFRFQDFLNHTNIGTMVGQHFWVNQSPTTATTTATSAAATAADTKIYEHYYAIHSKDYDPLSMTCAPNMAWEIGAYLEEAKFEVKYNPINPNAEVKQQRIEMPFHLYGNKIGMEPVLREHIEYANTNYEPKPKPQHNSNVDMINLIDDDEMTTATATCGPALSVLIDATSGSNFQSSTSNSQTHRENQSSKSTTPTAAACESVTTRTATRKRPFGSRLPIGDGHVMDDKATSLSTKISKRTRKDDVSTVATPTTAAASTTPSVTSSMNTLEMED